MLGWLVGNERADQLAKEAAAEECDASVMLYRVLAL
jgi:hypothetical protein